MNPRKVQPKWLAEKIAKDRRSASHDICPRCGSGLLVGWDGTVCALFVKVDVDPVGPVAELVAYTSGQRSFGLWPSPTGGGDLYPRDQWSIRASPEGPGRRVTVHLEHRCPDGTPTGSTAPQAQADTLPGLEEAGAQEGQAVADQVADPFATPAPLRRKNGKRAWNS